MSCLGFTGSLQLLASALGGGRHRQGERHRRRSAPLPRRADWKACAAPPKEEAARCEAFKSAFKLFDIMDGGA